MLGGEAANTANALLRWGNDVVLTGNAIGTSLESDLLWSALRSKNLPLEHLRARPATQAVSELSPVCDIYITPDGQRTMFGTGFGRMGPGIEITDLPLQAGDWFTADPNMSEPARAAVAAAFDAGMKCYVMDFFRDGESLEPSMFWQSSTDWVGVRGNVQRNVRWVKEWISRYGCFTILSDGPNGFVAGSPEFPVQHFAPYPAPEVVDSTGAGDTFRAGMLHGLSRGWPILDCLNFASAAGCLKCAYFGATGRVPTESEVLALIATGRS
jgi:sugar/nucleoside kinase (ribokinase family)